MGQLFRLFHLADCGARVVGGVQITCEHRTVRVVKDEHAAEDGTLAALWVVGGSIPTGLAASMLGRLGCAVEWERWNSDSPPMDLLLDDDIVLLQRSAAERGRQVALSKGPEWGLECHWAIVQSVEADGWRMTGSDLLGYLLVGARSARRLLEAGVAEVEEPYVSWSIGACAVLLQDGQHAAGREVLSAAAEGARAVLGAESAASARLDWEVAQLEIEDALGSGKSTAYSASLIVALEAAEEASNRLEHFFLVPEEPVLAWLCLADMAMECGDSERSSRCVSRARTFHALNYTEKGEKSIQAMLARSAGHLPHP